MLHCRIGIPPIDGFEGDEEAFHVLSAYFGTAETLNLFDKLCV